MLRTILIVVSGLVLGAALVGDWVLGRLFVPTTIAAALVCLAVLFEHYRYKRVLGNDPGAGWESTSERFVDPDSGKIVTVFFNAATGERRYVSARDD